VPLVARVPSLRREHQYLGDRSLAVGVTGLGTPIDPSATGVRVRDWLRRLSRVDAGRAASLDTRFARPGYTLTGEPTGFIVTGTEGPQAGQLLADDREELR
jgi:hypothetical protein